VTGYPYYAHVSYDLPAFVQIMHRAYQLQLDRSSQLDVRTFLLQYSATSNTTEGGGESTSDFFVNIDIVAFQLIQSKAELVVAMGARA